MEVSGLFDQQKYELVMGELIHKMGKGRLHAIVMMNVLRWLQKAFGEMFINSETPIDVAPEDNPTSEPQPDIVVLKNQYDLFPANPQPADFNLVVEISDSTLSFDLGVKARIYARASICELWVVDTQGKRVIVHREPQGGQYLSVVAYACGEAITPLRAPHAAFPVASAFPSFDS